jgi:flavin reductase (DIM6/NTAB) family NADH-FMN oxidoreductase RutF
MPVGMQEFRAALGHFASGVNVVTAKLPDGQLAGITVTAFCSVSLDPPLVLVCIDRRARLHDPLAGGQTFAVNLLSADQEVLSRRFATSGPDQFAGVGYTLSSEGTAWLDDTLAVIECRFVEKYAGGDHTIIVGQVEATRIREGKPLLYFRGGYAQLG